MQCTLTFRPPNTHDTLCRHNHYSAFRKLSPSLIHTYQILPLGHTSLAQLLETMAPWPCSIGQILMILDIGIVLYHFIDFLDYGYTLGIQINSQDTSLTLCPVLRNISLLSIPCSFIAVDSELLPLCYPSTIPPVLGHPALSHPSIRPFAIPILIPTQRSRTHPHPYRAHPRHHTTSKRDPTEHSPWFRRYSVVHYSDSCRDHDNSRQ